MPKVSVFDFRIFKSFRRKKKKVNTELKKKMIYFGMLFASFTRNCMSKIA